MTDPYARNLVDRSFYHSKIDIHTKIVVVLDGSLENRALNLIRPISRAFTQGSIIELIGTDDPNTRPGNNVNAIAYLGFVELQNGGILVAGDEVIWNDEVIGKIAGFDDTHMPNHQNTILTMTTRKSGKELGMCLGDDIIVKGIAK